jgi:acetyl-CoA carboxylase carboxyltransferase component
MRSTSGVSDNPFPDADPIAGLFDEGSFVEVDASRTGGAAAGPARRAGTTGWGTVNGRTVFAFVYDLNPGTVISEKVCKVIDLALRSGSPVVGIYRTAAVGIEGGLDSLAALGSVFDRMVAASGVLPQLALVLGPCAGAATFGPSLADFVFMTHERSAMFMTSPKTIEEVTAEQVTLEDLAGASAHARRSGVAHVLAADEQDCVALARYMLSFLPSNNMALAPYYSPSDDPKRSCDALLDLLPDSSNTPYDMRRVVCELADDGELFELHEHWAKSILVGFVRLDGHTVGIVASQPQELAGTLDIDSSIKGARFVRFCDAFNIPLISLVDVPGFLPGISQEFGGIIRYGAQLLYAFTKATVPRITVITRKAYGGAYLVMNSQHIRSDLCLAWPTVEIAVMGAQGAARVIHRREIASAADPAAKEAELVARYAERFSNPYIAAERGYIDEVIDPRDTRRRLIEGLALLRSKRETLPQRKHGNIPL